MERRGAVLWVRLNRPEVRNALHPALIAALHAHVDGAARDAGVRALVLAGEGPVFCAGADLAWMRDARDWSQAQHVEDARALFDMLAALDNCAVPTVARVQGAALGGGMGLLACCDVVVAADDARFGFTEAKLGLLPAVIAPFVVAKVGPGHARALFATAERFDAARAAQVGLVHHVVRPGELVEVVELVVGELLTSAPSAASGARRLVREVAWRAPAEVREQVASLNAQRRISDEGQEGMAAFLERRQPRWALELSSETRADGPVDGGRRRGERAAPSGQP